MIALLEPRPKFARNQRVRVNEMSVLPRCVVVGTGSAGRRHLHNLEALGIESIALRATGAKSGVQVRQPEVQSWEQVAAFAPSIAIIANPTAMHVDAGIEATRLGYHILIEKPLADRIEPTLQLQDAVARRNTTALVGYQFRYHPTLRSVRDWLRQGVIGEVVSAHAHWGECPADHVPGTEHQKVDAGQRDYGAGLALTLSHPLDYMLWMMGEVSSVSALFARRSVLKSDAGNVAMMTLRMASGALASISLDHAARPVRHTLEVVGTQGSISWDAATGVARARWNNGAANLWVRPDARFERNAMFLAELQHFLACVRGSEKPNCTLQDGVRSVRVAEAVLRSAREERVVDV